MSDLEKRNKHREYLREWRQTKTGRKSTTTSNWKQRGVKGDLNKIYDIWKETQFCDKCKVELDTEDKGSRKCMDHCHVTGEFRAILCNRCNVSQLDRSKRTDNTSGYTGITWSKWNKRWEYRLSHKRMNFFKTDKNKSVVIAYKFAILLLLKSKY